MKNDYRTAISAAYAYYLTYDDSSALTSEEVEAVHAYLGDADYTIGEPITNMVRCAISRKYSDCYELFVRV